MATGSWLPVIGWEGIYEVSDQGHVRRVGPRTDWRGGTRKDSRTGNQIGRNPERLLKPMLKEGRPTVSLTRGAGTTRWFSVHSLVAEAFIGPRPKGMTVNHKDGDKANNQLDNLEYLSNRDQQLHAHAHGL